MLQNLASICIKKAEFEAWRDCYSNSIVEYQKGLEYLLLIEEEKCSRKISSVYFQMANYILLESKENCEEKALEYYNKSKDILRNIIDKDDEKTEKT